jgi:hypothetical protein
MTRRIASILILFAVFPRSGARAAESADRRDAGKGFGRPPKPGGAPGGAPWACSAPARGLAGGRG